MKGLSQQPEQMGQHYMGLKGGLSTSQQAEEHTLIPSMQALRTTAINQDLVQQAMPQITGNSSHTISHTPNSNLKKGKKEKVEVVWPQDCAFMGHLRARVSYEQLTQAQFTLGFLRSVQEEENHSEEVTW